MKASMASVALLFVAFLSCPAHASPFDGWTLEQLKAHPNYVPLEAGVSGRMPMSYQREWNSPEAPLTHRWIGYIYGEPKDGWNRVKVDDKGGLSTEITVRYDDIAVWCADAIEYLFECGYFEGYP